VNPVSRKNRVSEHIHRDVSEFLIEEADLLDAGQLREWLDLLTDDVTYRMPVRVTVDREAEPAEDGGYTHFNDDRHTLGMRVERLHTKFAWAEEPRSRTRHFVSNIRVEPGEGNGEVRVKSNLLLYRTRGDSPRHDLLSAERHDVLRQVNGSWKLAQRTILLDQSTVGTHNLAVFL